MLDLTGDEPRILRPGVVTSEMLSELLGKPVPVITDPKSKVNSPGVKYKHYAPNVPMALDLTADTQKLADYYDKLVAEGRNPVLLVEHPELFGARNTWQIGQTDQAVAQNLFENLRLLEKQYDYIIASYSSHTEFADSILNRLIRSASHHVI